MKILIPVLICLLVMGCGKKETQVETAYAKGYVESHFLGTYENNQNKNSIARYILKENGRSFFYCNDVKCEEGEWKVVGGKPSKGEWIDSEIHIGDKYQWIVCSLNADHDLVLIATGSDTLREPRTRENLPKDEQEVYKKIQPKKFKTLEVDMVTGTYTATTKDEAGNDYLEKMVLFANGLGESFVGDEKASVAKWKIEGAHIKTIGTDQWSGEIFMRTQSGNLSKVGLYYGGDVMTYPVDERIAWEKIKADTNEPPSKGNAKNSTKAKSSKELTKEDVVGTYEMKVEEVTARIVILKNGIVESYLNDKKMDEGAYSIIDREVQIKSETNEGISFLRHEPNGDLTWVAVTIDGKRKDLPKDKQETAKKIK